MPDRNLRFALGSILLGLGLALAAGPARAQVNVETLRKDLKKKPRFLTLDGGFTGRLGNTQGVVAAASVFGGVSFLERHLVFLKAQGDYAAFDGEAKVSKAFAHARYNLQILPWLSGELFSQIQDDLFQRLQLRQIDGIGPRFGLVQREDFEVFYGTSYMFEYEVVTPLPDRPEVRRTHAHRWNHYLSAVYRFDTRARFATVLYFQPRFDDFGNVRLLSDTGVVVELVKPLELKFSVVIRHDTDPPFAVRPTDLESKNTLSVTF